MHRINRARDYIGLTLLFALLLSFNVRAEPIFDTHLHYNADDAVLFSPAQIIDLLKRNNIKFAAITSTPPSRVQQLYQLDPHLIVPLLGIYHDHSDKAQWTKNSNTIAQIKTALKQYQWKAIGELHLTASERHSPVFESIIRLAVDYRLPLLLHTDPAVIDTVYEIAPGHPVIWAHAGTFPYPDLLADYLQRYPALHADLSVRNERIAPDGNISDAWYELFVTFPDRFMIGVDTFSPNRWQQYDQVTNKTLHWLDQLPDDITRQLKYRNAADLFNP